MIEFLQICKCTNSSEVTQDVKYSLYHPSYNVNPSGVQCLSENSMADSRAWEIIL